jgi:hypothetical protein
MPMPGLKGYLDNRKEHADSRYKPFGSLPILLVPLHAPLKFCDAPAIAVAHQAGHLRLQYA